MIRSPAAKLAKRKWSSEMMGIFLVLFLLFMGGCRASTPKEQLLKIFKKLKTIAAKKDGKALYSLLSYTLKKRLNQKLDTVKGEFRKAPEKARAFLEKFRINPKEFQNWKGARWIGFLLSRGDFGDFQKGKIFRMAFSENYKRANLIYEIPGNSRSKISFIKEGGVWKINNHKLGAE